MRLNAPPEPAATDSSLDRTAPELEADVLDLTVTALRHALSRGAELRQPVTNEETEELRRQAEAWVQDTPPPFGAAAEIVVTHPDQAR